MEYRVITEQAVAINRAMTLYVNDGWEPVMMSSSASTATTYSGSIQYVSVMLKREKPYSG